MIFFGLCSLSHQSLIKSFQWFNVVYDPGEVGKIAKFDKFDLCFGLEIEIGGSKVPKAPFHKFFAVHFFS